MNSTPSISTPITIGDYVSLLREALECKKVIEEEKTKRDAIDAQKEVLVAKFENDMLALEGQIAATLKHIDGVLEFTGETSKQITALIDAGQFDLAAAFSERVERMLQHKPASDIASISNTSLNSGKITIS